MEEIEALLILTHIPKLSKLAVRKLLEQYGSATAALKNLSGWESMASWQEDLKAVSASNVHLLSFQDPRYPAAFHKLADAPLLLYIKGEIQPCDTRAVAVVGTRHCTLYGKEMTAQISADLAASGWTVVSGLARGIDTAAHDAAFKAGRTIAFIGSGLNQLYPKENTALAEQIAENGAVISEFPMHATPQKHHFPQRNRLISALSLGLVLMEAPLKSGAMITLEMAEKEGKPCFALPGRADYETFQGNHQLIKQKRAHLIENAQDILAILAPDQERGTEKSTQLSLFDLTSEEKNFLSILPPGEVGFEQLALQTKLPIAKLSSLLMELVLKQAIRELPGRLYKKTRV